MDETKQWEALKASDIRALKALYDLHAGTLYSYGMVLCHDSDKVRDCIHDLYLSCWTNRKGITIPQSGKAYLMVSLRRRIFDKGPKSNLETGPLEDAKMDTELSMNNPETQWILAEEEDEKQQKLNLAMKQLTVRQREILHMKYFQQMEYEEIAGILDLNYQSARNLVNRALIALRKLMLIMIMILGMII
jgi:RNA polymerase sigma-70 factor (ECF subfamily)